MFKKLKHFLYTWDIVWSAPLGFALFILFEEFGRWWFGEGFSGYDASFFQAGLYAASLTVLFSGTAFIGMYFNFFGLYQYYLKKSKAEFEKLTIIQKIGIFLIVYYTFIFIQLVVWSRLV